MRPTVTYNTKSRDWPIRLEVNAGLHVNVCRVMSVEEGRRLLADLESALARHVETVETKAGDGR